MSSYIGLRLAGLSLIALLQTGLLRADPVDVKHTEGTIHGFLTLRTLAGKIVATGDLLQTARGNEVISRLVFHFKDGSIDDDLAVFSQRGHFKLLTDHHIQKGPSFPKWTDLSLNTTTGEVVVRYRDQEKDEEKVDTQHLDLAPDVSNGMLFDILKNISPETPETQLSFVAATPKARLVKLMLTSQGFESFRIGGVPRKAVRYRVKVELGGVAGVVAPMIGKQQTDTLVWISTGEGAAFVKSEGSLYVGGPILRTELSSPVWSRSSPSEAAGK